MNSMRLLGPVLRRVAQGELSTRFDRAAIRMILDDTLAEYEARLPSLPRERSVGGRLMLRLAALTLALYKILLRRGLSESEARTLTAAVTRRAYEKMAAVPTTLSKWGSRSSYDRLKRATELFRRFPFSAPSYDMRDVDSDEGVVAFDVHRCPVAEHFREQGLGELCVESWCDLDFQLAEKWGARLERSTTLAGGGAFCDFRWRVTPAHAPPKG